MTDRCAEYDQLYLDWCYAPDDRKEWRKQLMTMHRRTCPKCKQRMTLFTQAAKTAEMPEMEE